MERDCEVEAIIQKVLFQKHNSDFDKTKTSKTNNNKSRDMKSRHNNPELSKEYELSMNN